MSCGPNLLDSRGRLLPRSYDVLGNKWKLFPHPPTWVYYHFSNSMLLICFYGNLFNRSVHNIHISEARSRHHPTNHNTLVTRNQLWSRWGKFRLQKSSPNSLKTFFCYPLFKLIYMILRVINYVLEYSKENKEMNFKPSKKKKLQTPKGSHIGWAWIL